ncbi:DEP domain-containing protein 1A [Protopterus annectens]|uniref:DEP domain-containing protein 1A n=1 Tax=Protopterus annectens TaxID=7888 RepID=UPI001CF96908|nr:DEP domain-containing protein 1A [Protopterus annectens]
MESRIITPGPYRATKLWNEITKLFRSGMPLRRHRIHFKTYPNSFTATEAVDWLHELLQRNNNFGPEVTRQQSIQLLRKFLKNHVIEDIKGRWGSEDLDDDAHLYRFPSTSPVKSIPSRLPLSRKSSLENCSKEGFFKFPRKTPKKSKLCEQQGKVMNVIHGEDSPQPAEEYVYCREITPEAVQEIWRNMTLIHLQKIMGLASLEDVLDPSHVNPRYIIYNMTHVNKHGVVTMQDKSEDLPHWVLSAMKCLANWPRNNDAGQPAYPGFERDVLKTVADYFLSLPEPLLTFEYYELFVNVLVLCGYVMISNKYCGKRKNQEEPCGPQPAKSLHLHNINFKSTECLLLSLVRKETEEDHTVNFQEMHEDYRMCSNEKQSDRVLQRESERKILQGDTRRLHSYTSDMAGGSCQFIPCLKNDELQQVPVRPRCCSVGENLEVLNETLYKQKPHHLQCRSSLDIKSDAVYGDQYLESIDKTDSLLELRAKDCLLQTQHIVECKPSFAEYNVCKRQLNRQSLCRSRSVGCFVTSNYKVAYCSGNCSSNNSPLSEVTVKTDKLIPPAENQSVPVLVHSVDNKQHDTDFAAVKRRCQSTGELSGNISHSTNSASLPAQNFSSMPSLLQPHLERVAVDALQICCLLLPPPNRRKLQLLMRMISRMSQNVDLPRLHNAVGTRTLMVQTFSRCVLCCVDETDLDELLATRLVSFLMDHHEEILQVPVYLQNAVQEHIDYLRKVPAKYPVNSSSASVPTYAFCRQISTEEFEQQKTVSSQAAIAELLESILKDKNLSLKDKRKKLKQFQKEYPDIYKKRFPNTESEAKLFGDKPKIKPPMLSLMKIPKMKNLRY